METKTVKNLQKQLIIHSSSKYMLKQFFLFIIYKKKSQTKNVLKPLNSLNTW